MSQSKGLFGSGFWDWFWVWIYCYCLLLVISKFTKFVVCFEDLVYGKLLIWLWIWLQGKPCEFHRFEPFLEESIFYFLIVFSPNIYLFSMIYFHETSIKSNKKFPCHQLPVFLFMKQTRICWVSIWLALCNVIYPVSKSMNQITPK